MAPPLRSRPLRGVLVAATLLVTSCGGSASPTAPLTPTPPPTPAPTPTPDPNKPPAGSGCHKPYPPPVSRFNMKINYKQHDYWLIDSTPLVGPNAGYCARVGYGDRQICPIRLPGADDRVACELWRVGTAPDTDKPGPTWTVRMKNGTTTTCTGPKGACEHMPGLPFDVKAYIGGLYQVCTEDGKVCGRLDVDRGL
jgi:hypothetical protein